MKSAAKFLKRIVGRAQHAPRRGNPLSTAANHPNGHSLRPASLLISLLALVTGGCQPSDNPVTQSPVTQSSTANNVSATAQRVQDAPAAQNNQRGRDHHDSMAQDTPADVAPMGNQPSTAGQRKRAHQSDRATTVTLTPTQKRRTHQQKLLDPHHDGWETEAFAEAAKKQLQKLFKTANVAYVTTADAVATSLPTPIPVVFERPHLRIQRCEALPPPSHSVRSTVTQLWETLREYGPPRVHVKVVQVAIEDASPSQPAHATTTALLETFAAGDQRSIQQTATLQCRWDLTPSDPDHPKIRSLAISDLEQVVITAEGGRWFADLTADLVGHQSAFQQQLAFGLNHWSQRIERVHAMDDNVRNGLAIGDANGDGRADLYVCQGPGLANRLLLQNRDGTVRDVSANAGVDWLDQTSAALFLDLDNDDDQDLAIATTAGLLIMENRGRTQFQLKNQLGSRSSDPQSLTAADYDNDGDLDLFLCVYRPDQAGRRGDFVFHDATTGGANRMFRNDLKRHKTAKADSQSEANVTWQFTDVTKQCGLAVGATRYSLASAWHDFDGDGDQDLYVANDYGRNYLYRNDQGHFTDVTQQMGLHDTGFGMSVSWGDINRDGREDLYIGNMFSSAGSRVTRQAGFQENASPRQRALYQRMAKGNSLFQRTEHGFKDISRKADVEMGRWAWSSVMTDLNNDGWQDLLVANGYITTEDTGDL